MILKRKDIIASLNGIDILNLDYETLKSLCKNSFRIKLATADNKITITSSYSDFIKELKNLSPSNTIEYLEFDINFRKIKRIVNIELKSIFS